jgi:release factor glutamine methyltransferase
MELLPRHGSVVDVGTGSGAIALSVATERPDAHVYATESSTRALAYATENARRCGATVEFFSCDLLGGLPQRLTAAVDVVVSNPPYVPLGERALLAPDVVAHEPHDALFSGEGGLEQISRLARDARRWLRPGGWLVVEIGDRQGAAVRALLTTEDYGDVRVARDYSGRERIATARA